MPGGREGRIRRLPGGFVGMLGLVMSIEWGLARVDLDLTAPWHWDWRATGRAAGSPEKLEGREILIFGDSLIKFGLIPGVVKQVSGKSSYNLGLHTGQASTSYFLLRRALRAGAQPSAIVLDSTPHLLMLPPGTNKNLWAELLTAEECLDISLTSASPGFLASTLLAEALASYKLRYEIRAGLMAALGGRPSSKGGEFAEFRRNWKANDGAQLMGDEDAPPIDSGDWAGKLYSKWDPDPTNVAYLGRFLGLAASRGIPVYWLLPPIHPEVQARTDSNHFDRAYSAFVRSQQARFPGIIVVDGRHSGFAAGLFQDGAHLNRRGARELSAAVGEFFRDRDGLATKARWANLDLGRARGGDPRPREGVASGGEAGRH